MKSRYKNVANFSIKKKLYDNLGTTHDTLSLYLTRLPQFQWQ